MPSLPLNVWTCLTRYYTCGMPMEEVAEIRPIKRKKTLAATLRELEEQGILGPLVEPRRNLAPVVRKAGALGRLLDSRD